MEKRYTKKDLARIYQKTVKTIGRWVEAGRIGHLKIDRSVLFTEDHLRQFEKDHNIKAVGEQ